MPIHDWSRVEAGIFHDFHQAWTIELRNALNSGTLPPDYFARAEQILGGPIPDVVTLQQRSQRSQLAESGGGIAVAEAPPQARFITAAEPDRYSEKANRIVIKHRLGQVVAVIEIVSPGNKNSQHALRSLVDKVAELLRAGIHLLVVDLFPPTIRDPQGIHKAIWDGIQDEPFELPADKPLIVAAYSAGPPITAYVDPVGVGDLLPSSPIFLDSHTYVRAPLEETYQVTWNKCPSVVREFVESGDSQRKS
jgi:hypothetical protein